MTIAPGLDVRALAQPLEEAAQGRPEGSLVWAAMPVPGIDPIALFEAGRRLGAWLWQRPSGQLTLVGVGEAWAATPEPGTSRFTEAGTAVSGLFATSVGAGTMSPPQAGPRLFAGFSFSDEPLGSTVWEGFGAARLVLPSLLLTMTQSGSWLTLSWRVGESPSPADLAHTWVELQEATGPATHPDVEGPLRIVDQRPDAATWRDAVARLAGAVGRGRLDKAALARRVTLAGTVEIDVAAVLRRLAATDPGATVFACSRGERAFLGLSPERLVRLVGQQLETMALAGSTRRSADPEADAALAAGLLASDKEREEHAVVVRMLRGVLASIADELEEPERPEVLQLRHVQHLVTPMRAHLRAPADVLALVGRLHPTPAVGGSPQALALELIAEEEPFERGWYGGPLGWVDRDGDGDFIVALRSGVVAGSEATLFAGCGIVADSEPDREWDESSAKLLALASALGRIEA